MMCSSPSTSPPAACCGRSRQIRRWPDRRCVSGGLAQIEARRKAFDRAAHDALGVAGLDLALDLHRQLVEGAFGGEGVGDVAEGILVLIEPAIGRHVDPPVR